MQNPRHFIIDMFECTRQPLKSICDVENYLISVARYLALKTIGSPYIVKFKGDHPDDDGITGTLVLATSLLSIHTYPKEKACYVDLFACSDYNQKDFLDFTKGWFNSKIYYLNSVRRQKYITPCVDPHYNQRTKNINYHTNQGLSEDEENYSGQY